MTLQTQRLSDGTLLFLPLPPSTNDRTRPVYIKGHVQQILTKDARNYIMSVGMTLEFWRKAEKFQPIDDWRMLDLWLVLPRTNCDNHNYFKVLFDAMEEGGIVTNDRYFLPCVRGLWHDTKSPHVVVKL